jgi:ketosteroid isomerase-like protein
MAGPLSDAIERAYTLARRTDHRSLRELLHDDATWHPAKTDGWKPCENADDVVRTMLWRASANRLRPGEIIELGDRALVHMRGRRLERLGARGLVPRLFQIIVLREGKIVSIHDYGRREDAYGAAGLAG